VDLLTDAALPGRSVFDLTRTGSLLLRFRLNSLYMGKPPSANGCRGSLWACGWVSEDTSGVYHALDVV